MSPVKVEGMLLRWEFIQEVFIEQLLCVGTVTE